MTEPERLIRELIDLVALLVQVVDGKSMMTRPDIDRTLNVLTRVDNWLHRPVQLHRPFTVIEGGRRLTQKGNNDDTQCL